MEGLSSSTGPQPFPRLPGALTRIGLLQVSPPSVDLLTRNSPVPFDGESMPMEYRSPLGAKLSQGSNAASLVPPPPVQNVSPGMATFCHVLPPLKVTPATLPAVP